MKWNWLERLYMIPILGLFIAIFWNIVNIRYVNENMNYKIIFYGGMWHLLAGWIVGMIIVLKFYIT